MDEAQQQTDDDHSEIIDRVTELEETVSTLKIIVFGDRRLGIMPLNDILLMIQATQERAIQVDKKRQYLIVGAVVGYLVQAGGLIALVVKLAPLLAAP